MFISIVAVTGLAGKAVWSWKPARQRDMWLRDWLGPDLAKDEGCHARVLTYGYEYRLSEGSNDATLEDYARQFVRALSHARKTGHGAVSARLDTIPSTE